MRTLCSLDAISWQPAPAHHTLAGMPHTVYRNILLHIFEKEVDPQLRDHFCDIPAPCVLLRRAMQICIPLLSVCKTWSALVSAVLESPRYWRLRSPVTEDGCSTYFHRKSWEVALDWGLGGRYRAYDIIEEEEEKSVLHAYDFGGPEGCHGKVEVVIKVSNAREQHENEQDVYDCLGTSDISTHDVPRLYFAGLYGPGSRYYALVLTKLGPDLERLRLRCRRQRFTPRMTLAVAIQTIRMYERLHTQGWLHCNAKAGNFAIGPDIPGRNNRVFMFDFEHAQHIEPTPCARAASHCTGWNCRFKPVTWEMHLSPSRRDDLEGLGYVLSYLERGSHPWQHLSPDEMWRLKICTPTKQIFEGMDPVYMWYFDGVKALAWGEVPDYNGIVRRFVEVWERKGYSGTPGEIDWWGELRLRKGAAQGCRANAF